MDEVEGVADAAIKEAARFAGECAVIRRGVALARWAGEAAKPLTSTGVLRKPDVGAACAAIGVRPPAQFRSAGDLPDLHRAWTLAQDIGLLEASKGRATSGPELEKWPPGDPELLGRWLDGLRAVCEAICGKPDKSLGLRFLLLALLVHLQEPEAARGQLSFQRVLQVADGILGEREMSVLQVDLLGGAYALSRGFSYDNTGAMIDLLADFGAVTPPARSRPPGVTPLGRWLQGQLAAKLPRAVAPDAPPARAICEAAEVAPDNRWGAVRIWLAHRAPATAVREMLEAADPMPARLREAAVDMARMTGEEGLPGWTAVARNGARWPNGARHARAELHAWNRGPRPGRADRQWLRVEAAAAALGNRGADEALCRLWESAEDDQRIDGLLAMACGSGHPEAEDLIAAVSALVASGEPLTISQGVQLRVTLKYVRPPAWRSVQVPLTATLGDLHRVIRVLFGWGGDHLHDFTVAGAHYSDPFYDLEEVGDEDEVRVRDAFPAGARKPVVYEYDFGASWIHEISREKAFSLNPDQAYPVCVAFSGDSPVEYPDEDESEEPEPFSLAEVNAALTAKQ